MATKAITTLISSQIDRQLPLIRTKTRNEGKKKMHELREKLPSLNDLKDQFSSSACSLEAQEKMEKKFNDTKKIIEKVIQAAEKGKEKLEKLEEKLRKIIESVIPKIQDILNFLKPIVIALKILIRVIPIILKAIPTMTPGVTGGMIIAVDDKRKAAASKVGAWANLIIVISEQAIPTYRSKTQKLMAPIAQSLSIINNFIESIKARLAVLDLVYLQYLQHCNVGNQTAINPDGSINTDLFNATGLNGNGSTIEPDMTNITQQLQSLYGDILSDITDIQIIERIENTEFAFKSSYRVINYNLNQNS